MNKRRIMAAGLAIMLLGGCAGAQQNGTQQNGTQEKKESAGEQSTVAESTTENTAEGVIEFEWWHALESQYEPIINEVVGEFNDSQDKIKVKPMYVGNYAALNEAIVAAHAAGTGLPGLAMANIPYVTGYGSGGLCEDLGPYIERDGFEIDDFGEGMIKAAKYGDTQVALPFLVSTQVVYYNKDMADELNVTIPEKWADMDQFMEAASKKGYGMIIPGWITWYYEPFFINNGIQMVTDEQVTDLDSEKAAGLVKQLRDWSQKDYTYLAVGEDAASVMREHFISQEALSVVYTSSLYDTLKESCDFEVGMTWLPSGDTKIQELGGNVLFIPSKNDQAVKDAAWEFLSYLESKEVNMTWAAKSGYLPIRKSLQETEEGKEFLKQKPEFQVIFDNMDLIDPGIQSASWNQVSTVWKNYMAEMITEDVDIDSEMKKMAEEINEILEDTK